FLGDLHVHASGASNDTGGDSYPIDIRNKAMQLGLDFVVLTDHSNSTGSDTDTTYEDPSLFNLGPEFPYWDSCLALSLSNQFLFVCGNEISPVNPDNSIPTGHIGCIPMDLVNFDKQVVFIDRPKGSVSGADVLQQADQAGCFKIVNHPYAINRWIAYDWTSYDYDAIEVWNGTIGYDDFDRFSYDAWICDLLHGRKVTAIGSSDNHRVNTLAPGELFNPALGYPMTAVFAENLTWPNIIKGLQEGKVSVVEGSSRLYIDDYTEAKCHAKGKDVAWIRLRGQVDAQLVNPVLTLYHFTSCIDPRPSTSEYPELNQTIVFQKTLDPSSSFDEGIKVSGKQGVYAAKLSGDNFHYWALSRAIVIN
ncbi:MAG: PHP domain-containing protein, partial [Bacteroidetes bacterium]|nr:PHP domain-containing protein [Bacteroidota bacterium]